MKTTLPLACLFFISTVTTSPLSSPEEHISLETRHSCGHHSRDSQQKREWGHDEDNIYKRHGTVRVKKGSNIQRAISKASPGTRIEVDAGTYSEQLTIDKDGIDLVGHGAILVPPPHTMQNTCSGLSGPGTQAGICVTGSNVKLAAFFSEHQKVLSVGRAVRDVSITGFDVRKSSGINIAVVGARNARVVNNKLTDGGKYGALTVGSFNTLVSGNDVSSSALGPIAVCMDNQSGVLVSKNKVSNHGVGLCVQTDGADVEYNTVTDCCAGVFVDPGTKGAVIRHNYIGPSNPACGGAGVIIDGAIDTQVLENLIEGQKADGKGAGLVVVDDECSGPDISLACHVLGHKAVASGNKLIGNTIRTTDFDIFINSTGKGNEAKCNKCSTPADLCSKQG